MAKKTENEIYVGLKRNRAEQEKDRDLMRRQGPFFSNRQSEDFIKKSYWLLMEKEMKDALDAVYKAEEKLLSCRVKDTLMNEIALQEAENRLKNAEMKKKAMQEESLRSFEAEKHRFMQMNRRVKPYKKIISFVRKEAVVLNVESPVNPNPEFFAFPEARGVLGHSRY